MAHLLVYLQRTPYGLHPASAVGVCLARDLASRWGATVTAIAMGDGGDADTAITNRASACGADIVHYVGEGGFRRSLERLRPRHVLLPWTSEAISIAEEAGLSAPQPRWVRGSQPDEELDEVTAIVAGGLPWHDFETRLEAEYEGEVASIGLPVWMSSPIPLSTSGNERPLYFVGPSDLDDAVNNGLAELGARRITPDEAAQLPNASTLLWMDAGPNGLPQPIAERPPHIRVVLLPGASAQPGAAWGEAEFVLVGEWSLVVRELLSPVWRAALT